MAKKISRKKVSIKKRASKTVKKAKKNVSSAQKRLESVAKRKLQNAKKKIIQTEKKIKHFIHLHPEKATAVAVGLGAAIGSITTMIFGRKKR